MSTQNVTQNAARMFAVEAITPNMQVMEIFEIQQKETLEPLTDSIREHGILSPLVVGQDNVLIDGHTRYLAALAIGLKEVPVVVVDIDGDSERGIDLAIETQCTKRNLTFEQKLEVVRRTMVMHPDWSNNRFAQQVGMSATTVGKLRKALEEGGVIEVVTERETKGGKKMSTEGITTAQTRNKPTPVVKLPSALLSAPADELTVEKVAETQYSIDQLNSLRLWVSLVERFLATNPVPFSEAKAKADKEAEKARKEQEKEATKAREKAEKARKEAERLAAEADAIAKGKKPAAKKKGAAKKGAAKKGAATK